MGYEIHVVSESVKSNSLGRALSMCITASTVGSVVLHAVDDGPEWVGQAQFDYSATKFRAHAWRALARTLRDRAASGPDRVVVWLSKCAWPLNRVAQELVNSDVIVIADFDDHDVAIMREFVSQSLTNRLKQSPLRRKSPERVRRAQDATLASVATTTFSSPALAAALGRPIGNSEDAGAFCVPHSRLDPGQTSRRPFDANRVQLGFMGTLRAHKGLDTLHGMLASDPALTLVTFKQDLGVLSDVRSQIDLIDPSTPLSHAHSLIDFSLMPMGPSTAAQLQLPAKAVDAASHGCPIIATPTAPLTHFFSAGAMLEMADWDSLSDTLRQLDNSDVLRLQQGARTIFETFFSPSATGAKLSAAIASHEKRVG